MGITAPVQTDQLVLRPVGVDDLAALIRLKTDSEVVRYLPPPAPTPDEVALALQAEIEVVSSRDDTLLWGIQRHRDASLIGHVSIWPREAQIPRGELIILVSSSVWRQGVAFEACTAAISRWLSRFERSIVYAAVHPENRACQALMRRLGLTQEVKGREFSGIHSASDRVFWRPYDFDELKPSTS